MKIYGKVMRNNAFLKYNIRVKNYNNGNIEVARYSKNIYRLKSGLEKIDPETQSSLIERNAKSVRKRKENQANNFKEIRKDNLHRSFGTLTDYVIANQDDFKSFITLTFKENMTDLNEANRLFNNFNKAVRRHYQNYKYVGVPEFQKRGAVHYHILTNLDASHAKVIRLQDNETTQYDVKQWTHGFASVFMLNEADEKFNLVLYMGKYFFKDIDDRLFNRNRILRSNNLKTPTELFMDNESEEYEKVMGEIKEYKQIKDKTVVAQAESFFTINYASFKK